MSQTPEFNRRSGTTPLPDITDKNYARRQAALVKACEDQFLSTAPVNSGADLFATFESVRVWLKTRTAEQLKELGFRSEAAENPLDTSTRIDHERIAQFPTSRDQQAANFFMDLTMKIAARVSLECMPADVRTLRMIDPQMRLDIMEQPFAEDRPKGVFDLCDALAFVYEHILGYKWDESAAMGRIHFSAYCHTRGIDSGEDVHYGRDFFDFVRDRLAKSEGINFFDTLVKLAKLEPRQDA